MYHSLDHPVFWPENTRTNLLLPLTDDHLLNIYSILYLIRRMWEINHNITAWQQEYKDSIWAYSAVNVFTYHIFTYIVINGKYYLVVSCTVSCSILNGTTRGSNTSYFQSLISNVKKHIKIPQFTLSFYCLALLPLDIFESKQSHQKVKIKHILQRVVWNKKKRMMRCAKFAIKVKSELCGERLSMENLNI